jgi:hypothetical protein
MVRMSAAGSDGATSREVADALYTDAVCTAVFGRIDDEIRTAVKKRRSIDLDAKWAQTLLASGTSHGGWRCACQRVARGADVRSHAATERPRRTWAAARGSSGA